MSASVVDARSATAWRGDRVDGVASRACVYRYGAPALPLTQRVRAVELRVARVLEHALERSHADAARQEDGAPRLVKDDARPRPAQAHRVAHREPPERALPLGGRRAHRELEVRVRGRARRGERSPVPPAAAEVQPQHERLRRQVLHARRLGDADRAHRRGQRVHARHGALDEALHESLSQLSWAPTSGVHFFSGRGSPQAVDSSHRPQLDRMTLHTVRTTR